MVPTTTFGFDGPTVANPFGLSWRGRHRCIAGSSLCLHHQIRPEAFLGRLIEVSQHGLVVGHRVLGGCGSGVFPAAPASWGAGWQRLRADVIRQAIEYYLDDIEDLRAGVASLTDPADPVLDWAAVRDALLAAD
jgi:hypothetical protein